MEKILKMDGKSREEDRKNRCKLYQQNKEIKESISHVEDTIGEAEFFSFISQ